METIRVAQVLFVANFMLSVPAIALADGRAGTAPPASRFLERFGPFQPPAVKQALRAAKQLGNKSGTEPQHDQILQAAALKGINNGTLSIRSATFLAARTDLKVSRDTIGLEIAKAVGSKLPFKEQKILVGNGSGTWDGAKAVAEALIQQQQGVLTKNQAKTLRSIATPPPPSDDDSASAATASLALGLALGGIH